MFDDVSQSYIGRFVNADSRIGGGEVELEWHSGAGFSLTQYAGFAEGCYTSQLLNSDVPPVDYNGAPESFPKWSYGGDLSYSRIIGAYQLTAESNYSFHDTYSQFFLLGSNDFTIRKYWLANANLFLRQLPAVLTDVVGSHYLQSSRHHVIFLPTSEAAAAGEPATIGIRLTYKAEGFAMKLMRIVLAVVIATVAAACFCAAPTFLTQPWRPSTAPRFPLRGYAWRSHALRRRR